jgi:uracil-DNA glycosylase
MESLLKEINDCSICAEYLPLGPRPTLQASAYSKICIIGQAPGKKVHESGIAWDDPSGRRLRNWLDVSEDQFYDSELFALIPMGFCYPGKGKSGDLPPRPECAPTWHEMILSQMKNIELILLIGSYSQSYYLKDSRTLSDRVKNFREYNSLHFPLPHPSPRNNIWIKKNPWFEKDVLPSLKSRIFEIL